MNAIRRQFFLSYAVIGSVMPLLTVFLRDQGFNFFQIGLAMSLVNVPMLCSPALITLLADKKVDSRRILAVAFSLSAIVLTGLYFSRILAVTLTLFVFHGLSFVAMLPLQDGFYFSHAEEKRAAGAEKIVPYQLVRVWGTVGFIVPSVILFFKLRQDPSPDVVLLCAVLFCVLSLANSFTLPQLKRLERSGQPSKLPTRQALAQLFSKEARWLCVGLALAFLATSSYYAFIANYYSEVVGIPNSYIGLIINIGVVIEIFYQLWMPKLQRWIGLKGILVGGLAFMAIRMLLLYFFPSWQTVVFTQIGHGLEVMALFIVPPMFLDRLAGNEFRNSIQGVYTMAVGGVARVLAGVIGGLVTLQFGLRGLFLYTGFLGIGATLIILTLFSRIPPPERNSAV
ncbi:MAG: hypothetical protein HKN23_12970 [Verrucomicrobiales bacterium]|nr:hypothetical protein [Verrucomicrobiales bacterium]